MVKQVTGLSSLNPLRGIDQQVATIFGARVIKAIIDDKNPEKAKAFKNIGEWSTIGCLFIN